MAELNWVILKIDGSWGAYTRAALQHFLKREGYYAQARECDGVFGYWSQLALQKWLKYGPGSNLAGYSGRLDGDAGDMTWESLGMRLAVYGYYSPTLPWPKGRYPGNNATFCKAIQRFMNYSRA